MLQDTQEGTFLVRDSSHPQYRLTLSVKTGRGPTNVRIEYSEGHFRLDSSKLAKPRLQAFPDVPSLVQHYVKSNRTEEDSQGHTPSPTPPLPTPKENALLLKLVKPLLRSPCPSLQHLTRLAINRLTPCADQLPLPRPLLLYLKDYPFQLWGSWPSSPKPVEHWAFRSHVTFSEGTGLTQGVETGVCFMGTLLGRFQRGHLTDAVSHINFVIF